MGLYDYIRCLYPLPEGAPGPDAEWQSKDTDEQYLEHYEIRDDGSLWHAPRRNVPLPEAPPEPLDAKAYGAWFQQWVRPVYGVAVRQNVSGEITFYTSENDERPYRWWEFTAVYRDGELVEMREVKRPSAKEGENA